MNKLLVNAPSGVQDVVNVGQGGKYFDDARVLWDERTDGPMPAIQLGGMVRSGNALVVDSALLAAAQAAADAKTAEATRLADYDQALKGNALITAVAGRNNAQFDTWWAARDAADKDLMLKFLVRAYARSRAL